MWIWLKKIRAQLQRYLQAVAPSQQDGFDTVRIMDPTVIRVSDTLRTIARQLKTDMRTVVHLHAMHGVLRRAEKAGLHEQLVLRGSLLLYSWAFGLDAARQPRDIDYVWSKTIASGSLASGQLPRAYEEVRHLLRDIAATPYPADALSFEPDRMQESGTCPYSEVPGQRFLLPWSLAPWWGVVQIDVSLDEIVDPPPVLITIDGVVPDMPAKVMAAPPELALAWKLQWLMADTVPQPKDLWDALVLVRHMALDAVAFNRAVNGIINDSDQLHCLRNAPIRELEMSFERILTTHWEDFCSQTSGAPKELAAAVAELVQEVRSLASR